MANEYQKHVDFLKRYSNVSMKDFDLRVKVAKMKKDEKAIEQIYKNLISKMLKDAKINFVIQNVPDVGTNKDNNQPEAITAKAIHHTMAQFGQVNNAVVFRKHAYVWFDSIKDAKTTHKLLNGMAIEKNIINTTFVA